MIRLFNAGSGFIRVNMHIKNLPVLQVNNKKVKIIAESK